MFDFWRFDTHEATQSYNCVSLKWCVAYVWFVVAISLIVHLAENKLSNIWRPPGEICHKDIQFISASSTGLKQIVHLIVLISLTTFDPIQLFVKSSFAYLSRECRFSDAMHIHGIQLRIELCLLLERVPGYYETAR